MCIRDRYTSAAGGAYGRVSDYDRFTRMLASGGTLDGVRILKPETVRMMYTERAYRDVYKRQDVDNGRNCFTGNIWEQPAGSG